MHPEPAAATAAMVDVGEGLRGRRRRLDVAGVDASILVRVERARRAHLRARPPQPLTQAVRDARDAVVGVREDAVLGLGRLEAPLLVLVHPDGRLALAEDGEEHGER